MTRICSTVADNRCLLQVGLEVFPIYGSEKHGWSIDQGDLSPLTPREFRYRSLDELFFALVNFNVASEGRA
jgi:hypothetical protein